MTLSTKEMPTRKIIALVHDLLLRSRIEAVAEALGAEVIPAATLELARTRTAEHSPAIIFADLSDANFPAEDTARDLRAAAPDARLVGFASHVDLKSLAAARAAGFDLTLSRSEFTARLPELLKA
jgi:DNA-binding NarL/FixJ family response regulator